MNPYGRFQVVSGALSGAMVLAGFGFLAQGILTNPITTQSGLAFVGLTAAAIAIWYTINHQMMPLVFEQSGLRSRVLGKQNIEGTWLQAERSEDGLRIAVIGIRPAANGFALTGYAMDENFEVVSNIAMEYSNLTWPQMAFKYRNTLVDAEDPTREGFGELQFELGRGAPLRYNGFCKMTSSGQRFAIEGARVTDVEELELLDTLDGREELVDRYWELFFERDARRAERAAERKAKRDARRKGRLAAVMEDTESGPAANLQTKVGAAFMAEDSEVNVEPKRRRAG